MINSGTCRMYKEQYPNIDDLVIVQVDRVEDMGAYVSLLEYNNIEGMIPSNEFSSRRIRSINKLIRVGRTEVASVLRVDKEKGFIDLSKRRVTSEDITHIEARYNKSKTVHSIIRNVGEKCNIGSQQLYEQFVWDLYDRFHHAYDAFQLISTSDQAILEKYNLSSEIQDQLLKNIHRRFQIQSHRLRADVQVTCFSKEGIKAIKSALKAGEAQGQADIPVKITIAAPPVYLIQTTTNDKERGLSVLKSACEAIAYEIDSHGGEISIKQGPRVANENDDKLLGILMKQIESSDTELETSV